MPANKGKKKIATVAKTANAKQATSPDKSNETACAVLSYFIIGIIWYFADDKMKKSSLARFHAKQGLVLLLAWVIVSIVGMLIFWIPFIGTVIGFIVWLIFVIVWIIGIVNAATGKENPLPIVGGFADKLNF